MFVLNEKDFNTRLKRYVKNRIRTTTEILKSLIELKNESSRNRYTYTEKHVRYVTELHSPKIFMFLEHLENFIQVQRNVRKSFDMN